MRWSVLPITFTGFLLLAGCGGGGSSAPPGPTTPVISSFKATSSGVSLGNSNALTWEVSGATSVRIDHGIGTVTGSSLTVRTGTVGTERYTLTASNAQGDSLATAEIVTWPATVGINPVRPPFVSEPGGAYRQPWGAAGGSWPEQLFWQDVQFYKDKRYEMLLDADGIERARLAPLMGPVAWGFDLFVANGGDPAHGFADYREKDGYKQYAAWMNPRADTYFARDSTGAQAYPGQGYISFLMPMQAADLPPGAPAQSFGTWAGNRLGQLCLDLHYRGAYTADFFIGPYGDTDWNPLVLDRFVAWAGGAVTGASVTGATVAQRHDAILRDARPLWIDFITYFQADFLTAIGQTLHDAGKQPLVGGQINSIPALARMLANDPRVWARRLPTRDWLFMVETQSAGDRDTPPDWTSLASIGATACREPDVAIGAMLDADIGDYWGAVARAGWSREDGFRYLKHTWLTSGWTHIANRDGSVRRAAQCFMRSFWDAGGVDPNQIQELLSHVPTHPFGPALYYSVNVEHSFEVPPPLGSDTPNYYYQHWYLLRSVETPRGPGYPKSGTAQGMNIGYWVSDAVDPATLPAANRPSAWLVYDLPRLPAAERARLEAVAPLIDPIEEPARALAAGPLRTTGKGLNCLAFVDQAGEVIVVVSNQELSATTGTMEFTQLEDGTFTCHGLLGTPDATLTITGHAGSVPISVPAHDTLVFRIPGATWIGHAVGGAG